MMDDLISAPRPQVVVLACGNLSRGDDAIGPLLLERLEAWLKVQGMQEDFELIYDYQFQIEHALDLEGRQLALFIDASVSAAAPFEFYRAKANTDMAHTSHTLSPEAVLGVWHKIKKEEAPPSFVLSVRGHAFELGDGMTQCAQQNLDAAFQYLIQLCQRPEPDVWGKQHSC